MKTSDVIREILQANPSLTNDQVAEMVRQRTGSTTSGASVASTKSRLKKEGQLAASGTLPAMNYAPITPIEEVPTETYEERYDRIRQRYTTLERMAKRVTDGKLPSLVVSGPPGLGKSYTVEQVLESSGVEHDIMRGTISAPGLYIALWGMKDGGVVVLDDCDDVFRDETCLNLLKAVLDSSDKRIVSYRKKAHWLDEMGIDATFEFKGSVVFCTNIDFEAIIQRGGPLAPHFGALIDRSLYLSLTMRTQEDFLTRIRMVAIDDGALRAKRLTGDEAEEIMEFVEKNARHFYNLSIRLVVQIAACYLEDRENWKFDIEATKMRTC